jgi:hypothetical protein
MAIHKVTEVFVGDGGALPANNTSISAITDQLSIVGRDMTALNPAGGDTITTQPSIFIVNRYSDGTLKRSMEIKGTGVTSFVAERYAPTRQCVWGVGYQRGSVVDGTTTAASGSITVANDTLYKMSILFKNDKTFYSERPERLSISFTSAAAATQSTIADQIVSAINNSSFGATPTAGTNAYPQIKAVKVGDGTGAYGVTGATNFGVEIWGLSTVNQFQTSSYKENVVYFEVNVDDSTGFGTGTACTKLQGHDYGTGTYNQVYNMENFCAQYEGVPNRRLWPIPTVTLLASSSLVTSGNVAAAATTPTGNVTATNGEDILTFATATTGLRPGEVIDVNGTEYTIKYVRSSTTVVLMTAASATYTGANIKVKYGYDVINISWLDSVLGAGANQVASTEKSVTIFTPALDASAADPFDTTGDSADTSAEGLDLMDILNGWMATTPLAPANISI